ncbi:MAG: hypothetical protein ACFFCO_07065 [Promethearchaeota archaeon]
MNRRYIASIGFCIITIVCIIAFFLILSVFAGPVVFQSLWHSLPGIICGMIGGVIGGVIAIRRRPDERMNHILKTASGNAWIFVLLALPYLALLLIFLPTGSGIINATWVYVVWMIALIIFGVTVLFNYWK